MKFSEQDNSNKYGNIPRRFRKGIRGTARNIEKSEVSNGELELQDYLAFRLEIIDNEGNVTELIPIEARGKSISGRILEGDTIIVLGKRNRRGLLKPKGIFNTSTRLEIRVKKGFTFLETTGGCLLGIVFTASVFGIIAGVVMTIDEMNHSRGSGLGLPILIGSAIAMIISIFLARKMKQK